MLYRWTIGRFRSPEAVVAAAESKLGGLGSKVRPCHMSMRPLLLTAACQLHRLHRFTSDLIFERRIPSALQHHAHQPWGRRWRSLGGRRRSCRRAQMQRRMSGGAATRSSSARVQCMWGGGAELDGCVQLCSGVLCVQSLSSKWCLLTSICLQARGVRSEQRKRCAQRAVRLEDLLVEGAGLIPGCSMLRMSATASQPPSPTLNPWAPAARAAAADIAFRCLRAGCRQAGAPTPACAPSSCHTPRVAAAAHSDSKERAAGRDLPPLLPCGPYPVETLRSTRSELQRLAAQVIKSERQAESLVSDLRIYKRVPNALELRADVSWFSAFVNRVGGCGERVGWKDGGGGSGFAPRPLAQCLHRQQRRWTSIPAGRGGPAALTAWRLTLYACLPPPHMASCVACAGRTEGGGAEAAEARPGEGRLPHRQA